MTPTTLDRTAEIKHRIESRLASIGIVGMGYVGLPLALLFSEERFAITGFDIDQTDIDQTKVDDLNGGGSYIVRIPTTEIKAARRNGFNATTDYSKIASMVSSSSVCPRRSPRITNLTSVTSPAL